MKRAFMKMVAFLIAAVMLIGVMPLSVFASQYGSVTNYADFLTELKQLEVYADNFYAQYSNKSTGELVLNFIRTGVERYLDGNWATLAGEEITAFTNYVAEQDAKNGTTVMRLRDIVIKDFTIPNGNYTDFGHMFGTMNISYVNSAIQSDDLAGWAGDLCDLFFYSTYDVTVPTGTVDEMAKYVLDRCFGVNADDAFGMDDFYGDMDAYYLVTAYQNGEGSFSELMEEYFNAELDDAKRSAYFLNNRFPGKATRDAVRSAIYDAYRTNVGVQVLEADRDLYNTDLRKAVCYAFADYLYNNAEGLLEGGSGEEGGDDEEDTPTNGFYDVFSSDYSILAPGISQEINYAMSADGKQMVFYVATVDVTRDDVTIKANYKDNDPSKGWGMQRVQDQVAAMEKNYANVENFAPVVAINGDGFNTSTGKPGGLLVMEGVEWHPVDGDGFFAILKDGSAMIGTKDDYETYKDQIQEAIGTFGSGRLLVQNGEIVNNTAGTRASRTAVGIKADGSVVMMVLDGRQEPFSCGGTMAEIAQIMYDAGCVTAVNLDGGGSTTYMSKPEGSDDIKVVNRPSDGYARSVAATLVAVSTAKSTKEFDRAIIESEYSYLTIGTSIKINAIGVNNIGSAADIPENAFWAVSDESIGTVTADGVFTAAANGDVTVYFVVNGEIAGSIDLHVVVPDALSCEKTTIRVVLGTPTTLPLMATYQGAPVAVNPGDFYMNLQYSGTGKFDGFDFVIYESCKYRTMMAGAQLLANPRLYVLVTLNIYKADEAYFDFDKATAGNRKLAWIREVLNATTSDGVNYNIVDPAKDISLEYTFALDMTSITIPEQLAEIVFMLPGSDTSNADSAFNYMLQLAERVSVLSEVRIKAQFDPDVDVDISELKVINDFFELTSATIDENNTLTLICNWIDRTQSIDPATANPVCILAGIKATPKADTEWVDEELVVINQGDVSFDVYLRASSLYSFANKVENQQKFGLYPYSSSETGWEGGTETGAHFSDTYVDFQDSFIIKRALRQGWYTIDGNDYYFVDHVAQTGIQHIPAQKDASTKLYYEFDENGVCLGTVTGVFEYNGDLYYAIQGDLNTGWIATYDKDGNSVDYYFDPATGKAVDGVQTIGGYTYTFTDCVLTRGDLVKDANGTRYRWAGQWMHGKWFRVDGKWYTTKKYVYYVSTGYVSVPDRETSTWKWHLFDENGVFQEDYTGIYVHGSDTYYIVNGLRDSTVGLVYEDGYYYYFSQSDAKAYKNTTLWVTKTNGLMPIGKHTFDANGRMIDPPSTTPDVPVNPPVNPEPPVNPPVNPDEPALDGIVEIGGELYYYENGIKHPSIGLVKLTDDDGKIFYIYIRTSTGSLATGRYWITYANGLLDTGIIDFGTDGKYYPPEEEPDEPVTPPVEPDEPVEPEKPEVKNGIYEENGKLKYYENGVSDSGAGLVKLTDENGRVFYIYVRSSTGYMVTGVYWPTHTNGLLAKGAYDFGSDGRYYPAIVTPDPDPTPDPEPEPEPDPTPDPEPEVKNGIYEENGKLKYYENGVSDSGAGLVKLIDEEGKTFYIYVRSSTGYVVTGRYWPTHTNGLLPGAWYDFGEDGRYYPEA